MNVGFDKFRKKSCSNESELSQSPATDSEMCWSPICSLNNFTWKDEELSNKFLEEKELILKQFDSIPEALQTHLVKALLTRMTHNQLGAVESFLTPMLKRDFISSLPVNVSECILRYLDAKSLAAAELVSKDWHRVISEGLLWKKLIEYNVRRDRLWQGLADRSDWNKHLFRPKAGVKLMSHQYYRSLYANILGAIERLDTNWKLGQHSIQRIPCCSESSKGVYCLQYDDKKIICGLRDNTIKIWDRKTLQCTATLQGHTGSVLCLQYDNKIIITGSSDATIRVWNVETGELMNNLIHHSEAVLHLRFSDGVLVTCSKDRTIAVWDMHSATEINHRRNLTGHRAAVNVVDFDSKYIVSSSGDRTIRVWNTSDCQYLRTLTGHRRGIACLQYRDPLIVSGSSDNTIRLWDVETGSCIRVLEGHDELVRCIRFDDKRIVSGAYDGKIKVWDLQAALDPRSPPGTLCITTLNEHTGRVFRLQFDDFQIVSSSHDDTIIIWDFLKTSSSLRTYTYRSRNTGDLALR